MVSCARVPPALLVTAASPAIGAATVLLWRGTAGAGLVIGLIKTRSFENEAGASADQALQGRLLAFRTFGKGVGRHALKGVQAVVAVLAFIFVGRHDIFLSVKSCRLG